VIPKKKPYPREIKEKVLTALTEKAKAVNSFREYSKVRRALETAFRRGALTKSQAEQIKTALKPFEEKLKAKKAPPTQTVQRNGTGKPKTEPALRQPQTSAAIKRSPKHERSRVFGVKLSWLEPKLEKKAEEIIEEHQKRQARKNPFGFQREISHWEAVNRAYGAYLQGTFFEPLWKVYFHNALSNVRKVEEKARSWLSSADESTVQRVQRHFNWKTFHVGMDKAIRHFGEENLKALARMAKNAKKAGTKFSEFTPLEDHIEITFGRDWKKTRIAIEGMENGKITKLGTPLKYDMQWLDLMGPGEIKLLEKEEKTPEKQREFREAMDFLNSLV